MLTSNRNKKAQVEVTHDHMKVETLELSFLPLQHLFYNPSYHNLQDEIIMSTKTKFR